MRVLMTADTAGGVWTYALELAGALAPHGVEVVLATTGRLPGRAQRAELRASAVAEARSLEARLEWMEEPWADVERTGEWLLDLSDEVRPDLVHLNAYVHGSLPWRAPLVVAGHSCVRSWFRAVRGREAPPEWARYAEAVRAGLAAADLVVAPTAAMLRELELLYGVDGPREAIPNGRSPARVVAEKQPLVVSVGRAWDEAKNVAALDRVAPGLRWPVVVAGPLGDGLAPRNLLTLGPLGRRQTDELLARASIFALPARYEPFGLAALEAALAGAALVLGDIPSLREVWGDAALYVHPDDDEALAATLARLVDDDGERRRLARRARRRAATYTPERMGAAYAAAYDRVAAGVAA